MAPAAAADHASSVVVSRQLHQVLRQGQQRLQGACCWHHVGEHVGAKAPGAGDTPTQPTSSKRRGVWVLPACTGDGGQRLCAPGGCTTDADRGMRVWFAAGCCGGLWGSACGGRSNVDEVCSVYNGVAGAVEAWCGAAWGGKGVAPGPYNSGLRFRVGSLQPP